MCANVDALRFAHLTVLGFINCVEQFCCKKNFFTRIKTVLLASEILRRQVSAVLTKLDGEMIACFVVTLRWGYSLI